jgi:hypothetical protein
VHVVSGREFDESRNTSRLLLPPPTALPNALRALRHLRRGAPRLVAWIEDGHPNLNDEEHFGRFGRRYKRGDIT